MPVRCLSRAARAAAGALVVGVAASLLVGSTPAAVAERVPAGPGAAGVGDGYFPRSGNGGYRVDHYDVDVAFDPATERLRGRTVVTGRATQALSRFNLDLVLPASSVRVNGAVAAHRRTAHELVVTPARPLRTGQPLTVVVRYAGVPRDHRVGGVRPWLTTRDGAVAIGQPQIAAWWFPSNDHPSDKAGFDITLRAPRGLEAISNGRLLGSRSVGDSTVWRWREDDPMATYLAFAAFGQYDVERGRTSTGTPYLYAYAEGLSDRADRHARESLRATGPITRWLARTWGPYPYDEIGGVALGKWIGFALENQTRPVYSRSFFEFGPGRPVVAHEMAHQWFGNRVAVDRWKDIWLNEAFATYSEWLYAKHRGKGSADRRFARTYREHRRGAAFWEVPIGDPGPRRMFSPAVYDRGAMTAHALRRRIGDRDFFPLLRTWVRRADGHGSTPEFVALAEKVAGEQLDGFFDAWLFTESRPRQTAANGFPADF